LAVAKIAEIAGAGAGADVDADTANTAVMGLDAAGLAVEAIFPADANSAVRAAGIGGSAGC
jgi:hypothetical protein